MSARPIRWFTTARACGLVAVVALIPLAGVVHEGVHAVAVLAQGGDIVEARYLPALGWHGVGFGYVVHTGVAYPRLVAVAPCVAWIGIAAAGLWACCRVGQRRPWLGQFLLASVVMVPLMDISLSVAALFIGDVTSDLYRAFAGSYRWAGIAVAALFPGFGVAMWQQVRVTTRDRIGPRQFAVGYCAALLAPWLLAVVAREQRIY